MAGNGRELNIYGYMVVYRRDRQSKWLVDTDDEYLNLPAHYLSQEEALDRVAFLRTKGIEGRVAALLAEGTDTAAEFESNRMGG